MRKLLFLALSPVLIGTADPALAKDDLGVFEDWAAFRDPDTPRCYAIAAAETSRNRRDYDPFASIGTWPSREIRSQVHFRLSRKLASRSAISLRIGNRRFNLTGGGGDAWARDRQMDAAIVAAMRSGSAMSLTARDNRGSRFTDRYSLSGAATAMDAATVGCARLG